MDTKIDNSLKVFARRSSPVPLAVLSSVALICLFVALGLSLMAGNWTLMTILLLGSAALGGFLFLNLADKKQLVAAREDGRIDWQTALPDIQRQNLNLEVFELSRILEVDAEQLSDLQSAYIVAEDLALRQIQQEENVPLMRHVSLGKTPFDAVLVKGDTLICVEVSFLVAPELRQDKIDAMLKKASMVKSAFEQMRVNMNVRLMSVLITQLTPEDEDHLRSILNKRRFPDTPVDIDLRLLDFETLQRIYITE